MPFACSFPDSINVGVETYVTAGTHTLGGAGGESNDEMFEITQLNDDGTIRTSPVKYCLFSRFAFFFPIFFCF